MCIICAKPAGVAMPSEKIIKNMWEGNDDGAGIMWTSNGKVHIKKGFMKYHEFKRFLGKMKKTYDMKEIPLVMHFRITTHGGTKPQNCHPFPVTSKIKKLQALEMSTNLGVAHNGTITIDNPPEISDTMAYISKRMVRMRTKNGAFYKSKTLRNKIEKEITSKMCFLDDKGDLYFIGNFTEDEGIYYSNSSYLGWKRYYGYNYGYGSYGGYSYGGYNGYNWGLNKKKTKDGYGYTMDEGWSDYDDWEYENGYLDYAKLYESEEERKKEDDNTVLATYGKKELMEIDGYIYNGEDLIEGIIFIDSEGHGYLYDEKYDICELKEGSVYNFSGVTPTFDELKAIPMMVRTRHYKNSYQNKINKRSAV